MRRVVFFTSVINVFIFLYFAYLRSAPDLAVLAALTAGLARLSSEERPFSPNVGKALGNLIRPVHWFFKFQAAL